MAASLEITHRPSEHRFETVVEDQRAFVYYARPEPEVIELLTTFVPISLRGKGVGRDLVLAVDRYAQDQGWRVVPTCWYARKILREDDGQETQ